MQFLVVWHRAFHKTCHYCLSATHGQQQKGGIRQNRWARSKVVGSQPTTSQYQRSDVGDMSVDGRDDNEWESDEVDWNMPKEQVKLMMAWLKSKGADDKVLKVIEEVQEAAESEEKASEAKDPWRELQSTRDKISNIETQLDAAKIRQDRAKEALTKTDTLVCELDDKYAELLKYRDVLKSKVAAETSNDVDNLAATMKLIQEKVATGIPPENSEDRKELYDLIYGRKSAQKTTAPQSRTSAVGEDIDENGMPFIPLSTEKTGVGLNEQQSQQEANDAQRQSKGFGPVGKGPTVSPSTPYGANASKNASGS